MAKQKRRILPISGDPLIDTLFKIMVDTLEKRIRKIYVKKVLRKKIYVKKVLKFKNKELYGWLTGEKILDEIYLGKRAHRNPKHPLIRTLIHEILHISLPHASERRIRRLEILLYHRFSNAQKYFLKQHIPKHTVKIPIK